jgi:hypothetical protein
MALTKVHTDLIEGSFSGGDGVSEELQVDTFTGDGTTVTFGLTRLPDHANNTQVYVSGVYQQKDTYTVSGLDLTFSEAPAVGETIEAVVAYVNPMYSGDHVKKSGDTMTGDLTVGGDVLSKDLYLSGGVYLGGTDAVNKLDDYEEGTWTATLSDASSGGNTTSTATAAIYTKIGNQVNFLFRFPSTVSVLGMTGSNILYIQGLPFNTSSLNDGRRGGLDIRMVSYSGDNTPIMVVGTNRNFMYFMQTPVNGAFKELRVNQFSNNDSIIAQGSYFTDS